MKYWKTCQEGDINALMLYVQELKLDFPYSISSIFMLKEPMFVMSGLQTVLARTCIRFPAKLLEQEFFARSTLHKTVLLLLKEINLPLQQFQCYYQ